MDTEVLRPDLSRSQTLIKSGPSPNRLRYRAEVDLIVKKVGDLEAIRMRLGLSRRKICQLLLVDPSAWTRWTSHENKAPPHIYRALEWYLALTEKDPRALLSIGSWSTTAFEERFRALESQTLISAPVRAPDFRRNWLWWGFLVIAFALGWGVARGL